MLTGTIPSELDRLVDLEILFVEGNDIWDIPT
jgi:hypothetical protein